jgi:hypothetical protein
VAKAIGLADLLTDVRAMYESWTVGLSDAVLTRWINRSLAKLWDFIMVVNPDHFLSSDTITVSSGTDEYTMSSEVADFYKGHGVSVQLENGRWSPLGTFPWEERHLYANTTVTRADQLYRYMGNKLYLMPTPAWAGTIKVYYIPTATVLTTTPSPNTVDLFNSWEEFIIVDVALKCATREEVSTTNLWKLREELIKDIYRTAPQRDRSHNDRIRDTALSGRAINNPFARLPRPT